MLDVVSNHSEGTPKVKARSGVSLEFTLGASLQQ